MPGLAFEAGRRGKRRRNDRTKNGRKSREDGQTEYQGKEAGKGQEVPLRAISLSCSIQHGLLRDYCSLFQNINQSKTTSQFEKERGTFSMQSGCADSEHEPPPPSQTGNTFST